MMAIPVCIRNMFIITNQDAGNKKYLDSSFKPIPTIYIWIKKSEELKVYLCSETSIFIKPPFYFV